MINPEIFVKKPQGRKFFEIIREKVISNATELGGPELSLTKSSFENSTLDRFSSVRKETALDLVTPDTLVFYMNFLRNMKPKEVRSVFEDAYRQGMGADELMLAVEYLKNNRLARFGKEAIKAAEEFVREVRLLEKAQKKK